MSGGGSEFEPVEGGLGSSVSEADVHSVYWSRQRVRHPRPVQGSAAKTAEPRRSVLPALHRHSTRGQCTNRVSSVGLKHVEYR